MAGYNCSDRGRGASKESRRELNTGTLEPTISPDLGFWLGLQY